MCAVRMAQKSDGMSLGIFRPQEVLDFEIEAVEPDPEKSQQAADWAAQPTLDATDTQLQRKALEQIPFRFLYRYRCSDKNCPTHRQSIVDWEVAALYRNVRDRPDWRELMRARWFDEMCGSTRDTAFIVGNQHQYLDGFLILGVWWPPRLDQLSLAESANF